MQKMLLVASRFCCNSNLNPQKDIVTTSSVRLGGPGRLYLGHMAVKIDILRYIKFQLVNQNFRLNIAMLKVYPIFNDTKILIYPVIYPYNSIYYIYIYILNIYIYILNIYIYIFILNIYIYISPNCRLKLQWGVATPPWWGGKIHTTLW